MTQHVLDWLPAYHDGELNAVRRLQVEKHLEDCPECHAESESLDELSALLKTATAPAGTPPERFAARVLLSLPRASLPAPVGASQPLPRWVLGAPLGLIASWAFLQAALMVTALLLGGDWLFSQPGLSLPIWPVSSGLLQTAISLVLLNLGLLTGTALAWTIWLAFWWAWKNNRYTETVSN